MAQNHQIKMSLMFDATTSKAKASLKDLQISINNLTNSIAAGDFPMTNQIKEAYVAAEKLKSILNSSVNMNTGQFDLIKFNAQLKQSGLSALELGQKMAGAGAAGAQTFAQLASTIANAELPLKRVGYLTDKITQSLKKTFEWQLSSQAIHAFTGALSSAYGYAKDLNRSLTDIRIVTGEGVEFMSKFAHEANKSARALSATTNEYAKASLIFYQQGLDDDAVAQRTAAVVKMANVTGENAEDISSYMTAIWNNFDNGTKSLEYYADAMTALGAATASSTEEIATGMQQFASVAETVGLSYEYAASALATVVSATRQSEDTVGTSFKTIFARLSSLSLGETLEDGTNLTKYSQALAKVGVDIKNQQGELKTMDQILDELGAKWSIISKEQQTALAYTVAGSRQYNNFISLLDNYEDFKINIDLAIESEGSLDAQQKIYAEGWEAAADRARAAAESIFEKLINDDFFIDLLEGLEKFLNGFDKFIDAVGGLPGILSIASTIMFKMFGPAMADGIRNFTYNISTFLGTAQQQAAKTKNEFMNMATALIDKTKNDVISNNSLTLELDMLKQKVNLEQTYIQFENQLSQKQKEEYQFELQILEILRQQTIEKQKSLDKASDELRDANLTAFGSAKKVDKQNFKPNIDKVEAAVKAQENVDGIDRTIESVETNIADTELKLASAKSLLSEKLGELQLISHRSSLGISQDKRKKEFRIENQETFDETSEISDKQKEAIRFIQKQIQNLELRAKGQYGVLDNLEQKRDQSKKTVRIAQEAAKIENWDDPMTWVDANIELQRYENYTSGMANLGHDSLNNLIAQYSTVTQNGEQPDSENYKKLVNDLDSFIYNFSDQLSQSAIEIASKMKEGLTEGAAERPAADDLRVEADSKRAEAFEHYDKSAKDSNDTRRDSERILEAMRDEVGVEFDEKGAIAIDNALESQKKAFKGLAKDADNHTESLNKMSNKMKNKGAKDAKGLADTFVDLGTTISGVVTVFNAFSGIFDVWSNQDMSFTDKLVSTFMSLGTVIPMAISAFNSLNSVMGISTAVSNLYHAAKLKELAATGAEISAMTAEQLVEKTGMTLDQAQIVISSMAAGKTWEEAAAEAGLTTAKGSGIVATIAQTIANWALQASMAPVLVITLAIIAALAILVISIVAVVAVVATLVSAFEAWKASRPDAVLAGAEEQAERLGEALAQAKEEADKLRQAIEKYDTAVDKVKGLVQGTDEYRAAVQEANAAARELIDTYDGLEYSYNSATGLIEIDQESLENAQANANNKVRQAEINLLTGQNQVKNAEKANEAYQLARKEGGYQGIMPWNSGVFQKREDDSNWETFFKGYANHTLNILTAGWASKIAIGIQEIENKNQEKGLNNLFEAYSNNGQDFDKAFSSLSETQQKAIDALGMTDIELANLCAEMHNNTVAVIENNKQIADSLMSEDTDYQNSNSKNTASAIASKQITEEAQALYEEKYKDKAGGIYDIDIQKKYAEAMGWDPNLVTNKNGNKAVYVNKDGEEVTISDETARRFLAEQEAQQNAKAKTDEYVKEAEKRTQRIRQASNGILTTEQADIIASDITTGKTANLTGLTPAQIEKIRQETINATDEFGKGLAKGAEEAQRLWKNSLDGLSQTARAMTEEIAADNERLSQAQLLAYGKSIETVAASFGADTAKDYSHTINTLMENNSAKAAEISEIASKIDWSNGEQGLRDLQGQLSEIGVYIDESDESWQNFAETLHEADISVLKYDLNTIRTQLIEIRDLTKDVELGSIISDEDYAKLLQYNGALADYFQMTADGYRYTGKNNLAEFADTMPEEILEDTLKTNERARKGAAASAKLDWDWANANNIVDDDIEYITSDENGDWDDALDAVKMDKETLKSYAAQMNEVDKEGNLTEEAKAARDKIKKFYDEIEQLQTRVNSGEYDDAKAYELYAAMEYDTIDQLVKDKDKFKEANQMKAYNKQMEFLVNQGNHFIKEYNEAMREFQQDELSEEFDSLMELEGRAGDAISVLQEQSEIYKDDLTQIGEAVTELGNQYGITQLEGESMVEFMARIAQEAPVASGEILELTEKLKGAEEGLREVDNNLADAFLKHFEDRQKGWNDTMEEYERGASDIAHIKEMMSLTGLDTDNPNMMRQLSDIEQEYSKASLGAARQNYEELRLSRERAQAFLQQAIESGDEKNVAKWQNTLTTITEMENDALETMNDEWANALETAAETLEANTQIIMHSFEESMAGIYGSFDRMAEVFDQQSELNTQYIEDYKKVYELSKLTRNIQNQIDNTESVSAKQALRELQEEVNGLQENSVEMSAYDLEYLQKKYDLRLAEIALEEAQNAKSQVRLSKMANGSWGYVYTANSNAVETAQQNYEDKLYELQDLSNTYLQDTSSAIIQTQADFQSAIEEIMSSGLSDEEKRTQIEETVAFYQDKLQFLTSEFDTVIENNQGMANMVQSFSESLLGAMYVNEDFSSAENIFEKWSSELGTLEGGDGVLGQLNQEIENYKTSVDKVFNIAGATSIQEYVNSIDEYLNGKDGEGGVASILKTAVDDMLAYNPENTTLTALDNILSEIDGFKIDLKEQVSSIQSEYKKLLDLQPSTLELNEQEGDDGEEDGGEEDNPPKIRVPSTNHGGRGVRGLSTVLVSAFASGGYTGEWGPEGKLAMLHEKELVLNAADTQNLLHVMEIMDQVIKNIDLSASAAASSRIHSPGITSSNSTLEQQVTIHAEFPNATNHSEIEQAFDTLINRASQYANRNR